MCQQRCIAAEALGTNSILHAGSGSRSAVSFQKTILWSHAGDCPFFFQLQKVNGLLLPPQMTHLMHLHGNKDLCNVFFNYFCGSRCLSGRVKFLFFSFLSPLWSLLPVLFEEIIARMSQKPKGATPPGEGPASQQSFSHAPSPPIKEL